MHHAAIISFVLLILFPAQSAKSAEEFVLSEDWGRFCKAVEKSDADGTLAVRDSLETSEQALDLYVQAHSVIAARLVELDRRDSAVETLERALATSKGVGPVSDLYAKSWSRALDQLCDVLVKNGDLKQIPVHLSRYDNRVAGYTQQVSFARIRLNWKRTLHGTDAVIEEATTTLAQFSKELPSEPTAIELEALLDLARNPACGRIPLDDRLSVLLRCRDIAQSFLRQHPDYALDYFKRVSEASYEAAKLYLSTNGIHGNVEELLASLEQSAKDLQGETPNDRTRDFCDRALADFRDYVRRRMERTSNSEPTIYESPLIGKKAPNIEDAWVIQGEVPKFGGETDVVILLDFWETWCGPCIAAFPKLNSLSDRYGSKGLRIVGVSGRTDGVWDTDTSRLVRDLTAERETKLGAMKAFVQHHKLAGDQLIDEKGIIKEAFGVSSFPTYVLLDSSGNVQLVAGGGSQTMVIIETRIGELLGSDVHE